MKPDDAHLLPIGAQSLTVSGIRAAQRFTTQDWVAEEVPVALEFNGISHAVMLATPNNLEDFALGFALSEGILASRHELFDVEQHMSSAGITMQLRVSSAAFARLKDRRRSMAGRTGCGLCGTESLEHVIRDLRALPDSPSIAASAISSAMIALHAQQHLQHATGAVHAAAWCTNEGAVAMVREDVGRHNALDKLIGALANENALDAKSGFVAITSRASVEMVQKTVSAGIPLLAAVSAATSLAVETALETNLTLAGFVRNQDLVIYAHPGRVAL